MSKIQEVIEKLEHTQSVFMAQKPRNDAEARINETLIENLDFEISKYKFQLRKLERAN